MYNISVWIYELKTLLKSIMFISFKQNELYRLFCTKPKQFKTCRNNCIIITMQLFSEMQKLYNLTQLHTHQVWINPLYEYEFCVKMLRPVLLLNLDIFGYEVIFELCISGYSL